jgi:polyhydroxyalkanoate synthesis regulator phasin
MNKQSFESLKREEEIKEQIIDSWKYIKDLEAELEFLLTREPNESKYIVSIKDQIDKLYQQVEKLENEVN